MNENFETENSAQNGQQETLPLMRIDIMTLFPDTMRAILGESILGRAAAKDIIEIKEI